jgi:hypothetical protein
MVGHCVPKYANDQIDGNIKNTTKFAIPRILPSLAIIRNMVSLTENVCNDVWHIQTPMRHRGKGTAPEGTAGNKVSNSPIITFQRKSQEIGFSG